MKSGRIILKISLHDLYDLTSASPAEGDSAAPVTIIVDHNSLFTSYGQNILDL